MLAVACRLVEFCCQDRAALMPGPLFELLAESRSPNALLAEYHHRTRLGTEELAILCCQPLQFSMSTDELIELRDLFYQPAAYSLPGPQIAARHSKTGHVAAI